MTYYVSPFTFDFVTSKIDVDVGSVNIDCILLYDAIKEAQTTEEGIIYERIGSGSGLSVLGPGVQVGLTVELLGSWQLQFPAGNYIARVAGGNLIGGPSGDPIAYTAGVQTLLIQSAASTVVTEGGSVPTAEQNAAATWNYGLENTVSSGQMLRGITRTQLAKVNVNETTGDVTIYKLDGTTVFAQASTSPTGDRNAPTVDWTP
jgi:hypothetical protein